ncbi:MAG: molecular chaperone GrpE, partial [Thermovirga sp.]|nr:molecular chaperone GrpE [Thermovirga sp.]
LLPVLDNLDMALSSSCGDDSEKIRSGVEIIRKQFLDVLCKLGLEPIDAVGKDFDPSMHEALAIEEVEPERDGKVLEEYQKGFILGGKVLRASKVKVGKSESKVDEKEEQN